jgi:hypothetical protein
MTSQINPSNIDATYPVAGQPNNTQGFRDNFTATQTNFNYAATEITDLQNKAVLKAALTGTTLDNNMNDALLYAAKIQDFSATAVNLTTTSGPVTVDYTTGHYQRLAPSTGSVSLGFVKWPPSGSYGYLKLQIVITNIAYTVTLPAAVTLGVTGIQGYLGGVITFAATGTYEFGFGTSDGGTTITVFDLNRPLSYYTNPVTIASTANSTSTTTGALKVAGGVGIAGNLYVGGDIFGNVSITDLTLGNVSASGYISATGNVTGGNVTTGGLVSATGNVTGGNVRTAGLMSATGNITGGNLNAVNLVINSISSDDSSFVTIEDGMNVNGLISATGNVTGGNVTTGGLVSATGNITGGNIISSAVISSAGNARILSGTAVPAGGTAGAGYLMSSTTNLGVFFGTGAPTLSAAKGSLYLRSDGTTTNDRMYVNTDGATTWTAVITAA